MTFGIIIFAPGSGGNHLRNILDSSYHQSTEAYDSPHTTNVDIDEILDPADEGNRFVISHMNTYVRDLNKKVPGILMRKAFLLTFPTQQSLAASRMFSQYPAYYDKTFFHEMSTLYSLDFLRSFDPSPDVFLIDWKLLWNESIEGLLDHIMTNTPVELDRDYCRYIHSKWCAKVGLTGT